MRRETELSVRLSVIVAASLLVLAACGQERHEPGLLDAMPAGYDVYVTFSPSQVGIAEVLDNVKGFLSESGQQLPVPIDAALGFDPFQWIGWEDALSLDPQGEMGLVVGFDGDEPYVIALFLSSTDADRVEGFVDAIRAAAPDMDATVKVITAGDYVVLAAAPEQAVVDDFEASLSTSLTSDEDFAELRGLSVTCVPAVEVYATGSTLAGEGEIDEVLMTFYTEEASLGFQFLVRTFNTEVIESSTMLAQNPNGGSARIPGDAIGAVRVSMDIDKVKEMTAEYIPPDAQMGVAMLGFESIDDMFDMFTGDAWFALRTDGREYAGMVAYGLADKGALDDMLTRMSGMMGMSGQGFSSFQFQGHTCYSVDVDLVEGISSLEMGIVGDAMVVAGGYTLQEVADGITFTDYMRQNGLGVPDEGGFALAADLGGLAGAYGLNEASGNVADFEEFGFLALSGSTDRAIFQMRGSVNFGSGNPFAVIADMIASMAIARMHYPVVTQAPIEMPPVEELQTVEEPVEFPLEEPVEADSAAAEPAGEPVEVDEPVEEPVQ
jgi:hypothetical protein